MSKLDFYHEDDLLTGCEVIEPKRITLRKDGESWLATFHGDAEMVEAFRTGADVKAVAHVISTNNPEHQIWYLGRRMDT